MEPIELVWHNNEVESHNIFNTIPAIEESECSYVTFYVYYGENEQDSG
jgi:hypothetical protein